MATVTSLTEEKIQELTAGWVGVALSQDEINALVQQLWTSQETSTANLEHFQSVVLPQLEDDLAAGSIKVSELNDTTIPDLEAQLDQHRLELTNLNTVDIPGLNAELASANSWFFELEEETFPALQAQIDANTGALTDLNTVTLPGLADRLTAVEGSAGGSDFDPSALWAQIDANTGELTNLNTVILPGLDDRLESLETDPGFDPSALQGQLDTLAGKFPVVGDDIAADTITANQIATDAVTANEIAAHTITAMEIAADTITANEIAADSITASEIAARTITAAEIAVDTITANEIAADSITASEIAARTITAAEIAVDAITANEIAADSITASEIAAHTITAAEIFADTITANEIATDTITANEIAARTITAAEIAVDTITANEIASRTITALEIKANEITANEIKADTITANEIATDAITANEIAAGAVTATEILANTITALQIATDAITADEIAANTITANEVAADILIANQLYSREGYFGIVEATQINSGAIDAELGLLGKLQVGQITIEPEVGISVPGPNGLTILSATGVGHRFAGAVDTDEVTVNGGLTVNAANNTINGQIKLSNVVIPPTQPAGVTRYWPYTAPIGADTLSLTDSHDGTKWVSFNNNDKSVRTYLKTTGVQVDKFVEDYWHHDYVVYNISRVGNYYFMIMWMQSTSEWWLCRVGNAFGSFTALTKIVAMGNVGVPAVGPNLDNGNVMVGYAASDDTSMRIIEYTTAGVQVTSELWDSVYDVATGDRAVTEGAWCNSIIKGATLGFGETPAVLTDFGSWVQIWSPTTKKITGWPGRPEAVKGICVEFGTTNKLRWIGYNTYRIYEFVREAMWGASHSITYSWFDSKLAGSGKHETTPAPPNVYTGAYKWAALQIDASAPSNTGGDDSPDSVVIYIDNNRQPEVPVGKVSNIVRGLTLSGVPAKTSNEFAGAAAYPGSIKSDATLIDGITPRFLVRGDGQGNWGDLVVDGFGKATIGGDTGWIAVTAFVNLWENYGTPYAPVAYRKIGNRVHLRGLIRGPGNLGGVMFTLPVGFRPVYTQIRSAVFTQFADTFSATGENSATFNTGAPSAGSAHNHPVNIPTLDVTTAVLMTNIAGRLDIQADGGVNHNAGANWRGGTNWVSLEGISFYTD